MGRGGCTKRFNPPGRITKGALSADNALLIYPHYELARGGRVFVIVFEIIFFKVKIIGQAVFGA